MKTWKPVRELLLFALGIVVLMLAIFDDPYHLLLVIVALVLLGVVSPGVIETFLSFTKRDKDP